MTTLVYRALQSNAWQKALSAGSFAGSEHDERDGFIHLSAAHQVAGTLAKHYTRAEDLVLLEIPASALGEDLRWEVSRGGEKFPHLYATLKTESVCAIYLLPLDERGIHQLPSF